MNGDGRETTRVRLFGLDFLDAASVGEVAELLLKVGPGRHGHDDLPVVVTPNVDHLVRRNRRAHPDADWLTERARFVLADGQPIVWASHLLGRPLRQRLAGSSLTECLWPQLVASGRPALVVASSPSISSSVDAEGDAISAILAPQLDAERTLEFEAFSRSVRRAALEHRADFVFVTIGHPKQNLLIRQVLDTWPDDVRPPLFLAVGASFDMFYGHVRRAPMLLQRAGLEWLFRFAQEPRRLFRRYFVDDPAFVGMVVREWRSGRASSRRAR